MATMYISEYSSTTRGADGLVIQVGQEPAIAEQQIPFDATAAQSNSFDARTRFIRVSCDSEAFLLFGNNPTATALNTGKNIQADVPEFFGVVGGHKVSAIT